MTTKDLAERLLASYDGRIHNPGEPGATHYLLNSVIDLEFRDPLPDYIFDKSIPPPRFILCEEIEESDWANRLGEFDELPPTPMSILKETQFERACIYLRHLTRKETAFAANGMSGIHFPNIPFGD